MIQKDRIILASSSPRRKELLAQIGLDFKVIKSKYKESLYFNSNPHSHVKDLARNKALDVANLNYNSLVVGADTIIFFDNKVFGKPKTANQAFILYKSYQEKLISNNRRTFAFRKGN